MYHLPYGANKQDPTLIVIHAMGEYIKDNTKTYSAFEWLKYLKLSAHALVYPDGSILRTRRDTEGAYHAKGYNTNSLGIEFLVPGVHTYSTFKEAIKRPYVTEDAMEAGKGLISYWLDNYKITEVSSHSDLDPKRKIDPGKGFSWREIEGIV